MYSPYLRACVLAVVLSAGSIAVHANTYTVNDLTDGYNTNQLRGALLDASAAGGGPHTINLSAGTYTLTLGEIIFGEKPVTLSIVGAGAGSSVINMTTGTGQDRIFIINTTGGISNVVVSISGVSFTGGHLKSDNFGGGAILGGGPGNSITLSNCIFQGNSIDGTAGTHGGAIAMTGGGSLSIDHCQFITNSTPTGEGGAIYYAPPNDVSGSLSITNSYFKNNLALGSSGAGGALSIHLAGGAAGVTSSVSLQQDVIIGNQTSGNGGGIYLDNSFSSTNTVYINYNRIVGNLAGSDATNGIGMAAARGNLDATNNWWGCNGGPSASGCNPAAFVASGGTGLLQTSPYLQLTSTAGSGGVCLGNAATLRAGFTKNSAGATVPGASLGALAGLTVYFSAGSGSFSASSGTVGSDGVATTDFIPGGTGSVTVYTQADNVAANDATTAATVTTSSSAVASGSTSGSGTVSTDDTYLVDGSCNRIARVVPSGVSPVSGTVTSSVTIDAVQSSIGGSPYVKRHYTIVPATNSATATATITLYATQGEFDSYNAAMPGTANDLPTTPADNAGRANLRVTQYHTNGSAVLIDPGAANVNWNATTSLWEISFDVTGFSGFYLTGLIADPLPVKLERFTAAEQAAGVLLQWVVGIEDNVNRYEIERSGDGADFQRVGSVNADHHSQYSWLDATPLPGESYYRLRMVDNDGKENYSQVLAVHRNSGSWQVTAAPNPWRDQVWLTISAPEGISAAPIQIAVADLTGKLLLQQEARVQAGANALLLQGLDRVPSGVYILRITGQGITQTIKLMKIDPGSRN